jgi:hypothetical protein
MYCKIVKSHLRFATNLKSQNLIKYIYNNYNVDCDTIKKFEQILTNSIDLAAMKILSHLTHLLLLANYCDAFYVANSQQQMRAVPSTLIRSTRRSDDGVGHSFVEGGQYESQRAEIEAMGGGNMCNNFALEYCLYSTCARHFHFPFFLIFFINVALVARYIRPIFYGQCRGRRE